MRILRVADYKSIPWKNGGGITREIFVFPPASDLDNFGWRISMATVSKDGAFSELKCVDRSLCVLQGAGVTLSIPDYPVATISQDGDPISFSGDTGADACLLDGEITDLNVMTRRGRFWHRLDRVTFHDRLALRTTKSFRLVVAISPCQISHGRYSLAPFDSLLIEPYEASVNLSAGHRGSVLVAEVGET